jgi:hypothetical protein
MITRLTRKLFTLLHTSYRFVSGLFARIVGILRQFDYSRLAAFDMRQAWHTLLQGARLWLGWFCIILGLILLPLPIPLGLILLVIGTMLVGPRTRIVRLAIVRIKLLLRRWARLRLPLIANPGKRLLRWQRHFSVQYRRKQRILLARKTNKASKQ